MVMDEPKYEVVFIAWATTVPGDEEQFIDRVHNVSETHLANLIEECRRAAHQGNYAGVTYSALALFNSDGEYFFKWDRVHGEDQRVVGPCERIVVWSWDRAHGEGWRYGS